jgi:hypothetical protein
VNGSASSATGTDAAVSGRTDTRTEAEKERDRRLGVTGSGSVGAGTQVNPPAASGSVGGALK